MINITATTSLFGDAPMKSFTSDGLDEYRSEIEKKWKLIPSTNIQKVEEEQLKEAEKPKKINIDAPVKNREIIKGSTGSKIFSMLQNMKPGSRIQKENAPNIKSSDPTPPKRKLAFSK